MAANGDELVTLKQVRDNRAFKKINSEYGFSVLYPDVSDMSNTMIYLNERNDQNNVTMIANFRDTIILHSSNERLTTR